MIDDTNIKQFALEQIARYQKILDCNHSWNETERYPSPVQPICRIMYKCIECGVSAGETIPWSFTDHLTYMRSKRETKKD